MSRLETSDSGSVQENAEVTDVVNDPLPSNFSTFIMEPDDDELRELGLTSNGLPTTFFTWAGEQDTDDLSELSLLHPIGKPDYDVGLPPLGWMPEANNDALDSDKPTDSDATSIK